MLEALESRHIGHVLRAFRRHPYHGRPFSQEAVGRWLHKTQPQMCRLETGPMVQSLDQLCFLAQRLRIPAEFLWFEISDSAPGAVALGSLPCDPTDGEGQGASVSSSIADGPGLLASTSVAAAIPGRQLAEVERIARGLDNEGSRHDIDRVAYLDHQLDRCTAEDAARGARAALPLTLGLVAAIEVAARRASPTDRRDLLVTGARAAEFVGWLYRDLAAHAQAHVWCDRAMEWAQMSGDLPMQGYVLLKKAQAAWDQRDTFRMLRLSEAAREGPWRLPPRVHAETLQQEARAHAMLGDSLAGVDARLQDAAERLGSVASRPAGSGQAGGHYGSPLLALQTAICQREAGRPEQAVELYDANLRLEWFSRRDFGYFRALMAFALADAHEPEEACAAGMESLVIAMDTGSGRTIDEVRRLHQCLDLWSDNEAVAELGRAIPVVSGSR